MDKIYAIRLYGLAINFWQLTLNASKELVSRGNPSSLFFVGWKLPSDEELNEHTKWSDINIAEPTLFNFYHGMELSLKALILAKGIEVKNDHRLSSLLTKFSSLYAHQEINEFYEKYIQTDKLPSILKEFCNKSNMTMDLYFQSLKYPASTNNVDFDHSCLRYKEENGVDFFKILSNDLIKAKKEIEQLIMSECKDVFV